MKTRKGKYMKDPEEDYVSDESSRESRKSEELGSIAKEDELVQKAVEESSQEVDDVEHEDDEDNEDDEDEDDEDQSQELLPFLVAQAQRNAQANPPHELVHRRLLDTGMTHRHVLNPKTSKYHLVPMTQTGPTPPSVDENDQDSRFEDPLPHSNDWPSSSEEKEKEEKEKKKDATKKKKKKKKKSRGKNEIIEIGDSSQESAICGGIITQNDLDEQDSDSDESCDRDKKPAAKKSRRKNVIVEIGDSSQDTLLGADLKKGKDDEGSDEESDDGDKKPAARKPSKKEEDLDFKPFVPSKEIPLLKYLKVSLKANKTVLDRKVYIRHFARCGIQPYIKPEAMADAVLGPEIVCLEERLKATAKNHEKHWKMHNIGEWMWSIHRYIEIAEARYGKRSLPHVPKTVRLFKEHIVRMQEYAREKAILDEAARTGHKRGKYKVGGQPSYAKETGDLVQHLLASKYNGRNGRKKWTSMLIKDKKCPDCDDMCLMYDKTQKELKAEYAKKEAKWRQAKADWDDKVKDFQPKKGEKEPKRPNFPVRHVVCMCMCMLLHCEHVHTGKGCPKCVDFILRGIKIPQTSTGDCDCKVCRCNCMTVFPDSQWAAKIREVTEKRLKSVDDDNKKAFQSLVAQKNAGMKQVGIRESFSHMGMLASMVNDPYDGIGVLSPGPYPDKFTMDFYQRHNPSTAFTPLSNKHARNANIVTGSGPGTDHNVRRRLNDDIKDELALRSHRILNEPSYSSTEGMEKRAALQLHFPKSTEVRDEDGNETSITDLRQQYKEVTQARRNAYEMHRRNQALNNARASPPSASKRSPYSYAHIDQKVRNNGLDMDYPHFHENHGDEHLRRPDNVAEGDVFDEDIPRYPYPLEPGKRPFSCDPVQDFPRLKKMRAECLAVVKNPNCSNIDKGKAKRIYSMLNGFVKTHEDFATYQMISTIMKDAINNVGYTETETMGVLLDML